MSSPLSGKIVEVNKVIIQAPVLISDDPEGEYWILKIKLDYPPELERLSTKPTEDD